MCFMRGDLQALALEAGDDLAGEAALERVGLHEDQGAVQVFLHAWGRIWRPKLAGAGLTMPV